MLEIRIHGRGGQGGVIALEILATAYFKQGQFVQVFPEFGAERRGAPVAAFMRVDKKPVRLRCKIYKPDCIIVLDPVLLNSVDVTEGLKEGGLILINSEKSGKELNFNKGFSPAVPLQRNAAGYSRLPDKSGLPYYKVYTVDATGIAIKYGLGARTSPIVNTTVLGAFCKLPLGLDIKVLKKAIEKKITIKTKNNLLAADDAYNSVKP